MLLRVDIADRDGVALVTASGEIDAATADILSEAISGALEDGYRRVVVDFSEVTFIDSTGLSVLVRSHRAAVAKGGMFAIVHPTPQTRKLIKVLGLDLLLNIFDTLEQALAQPPG
jgi:anti-sigma B factor antagonist